jgi:uncharacterized phage protein (TIGR02218 family)
MRMIPEEFQTRLDSGATTLCRCWKIERSDGRIFGFTDHDLDLSFDGLVFEAGSSLDANALQLSTGLSVDNCQAQGALSAEAISEEDIRAGRFDAAKILHWLVDWTRPDLRVLLFSGSLGEFRQVDGRFEVELRGPGETLNAPVGRSILRTCDRVLGDAKCRVDLDADRYNAEAVVSADAEGGRLVCKAGSQFAHNWFRHGTITWLTGENVGVSRVIRGDRLIEGNGREIDLWRAPPFLPRKGDQVRLFAGCDKLAGTCRAKFDNFLNFRGFLHLPGEDWVAAYPREGEVHDGSSLR